MSSAQTAKSGSVPRQSLNQLALRLVRLQLAIEVVDERPQLRRRRVDFIGLHVLQKRL